MQNAARQVGVAADARPAVTVRFRQERFVRSPGLPIDHAREEIRLSRMPSRVRVFPRMGGRQPCQHAVVFFIYIRATARPTMSTSGRSCRHEVRHEVRLLSF